MSNLADSTSFFAARTKRLAETGHADYGKAIKNEKKPAIATGMQIDSKFEVEDAKFDVGEQEKKDDARFYVPGQGRFGNLMNNVQELRRGQAKEKQEQCLTPPEAQPSKDAGAGDAMTRMSQDFAFEAATKQDQGLDISKPQTDEMNWARPQETSHTYEGSGFFNISDALKSIKVSDWKPLAVRNMPPLPEQKLANKPMEAEGMAKFTKAFLVEMLGGKAFSPGFYFSPGLRSLPSETYYILDADIEPYLPQTPGEHGAKLSVFFRNFDDNKHEKHYHDVPLFVSNGENEAGENVYRYFGTYSQMRWSDKLSYDEVAERVPVRTKQFWSAILTRPERPKWQTDALVSHFVPKPEYTGEFHEHDDIVLEEHADNLKDYLEQLQDWTDDRDDFLARLTEAEIMKAFDQAEADDPPGLRFYWEYLQCVGFDRPFYQALVTKFRGE